MEIKKFIFQAMANLINFCNDKYEDELWPDGPTGYMYLSGLVRDKGQGNHRGSYVPGLTDLYKTIEFLQKQEWSEFTPVAKRDGCRYFQTELPENGRGWGPAYVGVLTFGQCRHKGWDVYLEKGEEHGDRLVTREKPLLATNTITLIVEGDMMSTWHPGEPMSETTQPIPTPSTKWKNDWPVYIVK